MKQNLNHARRAAALLLAAAALPLTPLFAQDTQPPPATESAPPPAATPPVDVAGPPAPVVAPAPRPVSVPPVAAAPAPVRQAPAAPTARSVARAPVRAPAATATASRPVRATTTHTVTSTTAATRPVPAPIATPAPATAPVPVPIAEEPAPAPVAAPAPATLPPAAPAAEPTRWVIPALVIGALLLALVAFALARRRRRDALVYDESEDSRYDEPVAEPVVAAPVAAAAPELRRPWLDLQLQPVRAGVEGEEAVVEFALQVDNKGGAPARDVRVSAFMLQAGASEAESSLIAPKEIPAVTIAAGETRRVETSVALPTDRVEGDAVLPVVVADARYTLPDGSEGRTQASFAVGVPDGAELAHFAVDNPSGLHDDVVARQMGEMEKA